MICYKCHNQMRKQNYNNVIIDRCLLCGSVWLDKNEFDQILLSLNKTIDLNYAMKVQKMKEFKKINIIGYCPRCNTKKLQRKIIDDITIDYCESCGGMFFDYGQFQKLLKINYTKTIKNWFKKLIKRFF